MIIKIGSIEMMGRVCKYIFEQVYVVSVQILQGILYYLQFGGKRGRLLKLGQKYRHNTVDYSMYI